MSAIPAGAEVAEAELDAIGSFVDLTANPASFDSVSDNEESVSPLGGTEGSSLVLGEMAPESPAGIAEVL